MQFKAGTKVLIASPTYDGNVRSEYMRSIMRLTDELRERDVAWRLLLESATLLHTMRSVMASLVFEECDYSHLLFVDTDLNFDAASVLKMLAADMEVIGCAYPYRTVPLHETVTTAGCTLRQVIAGKVPYAITLPEGIKNIDVVNGICEVASIGTGLLLIRRSALESLASSGQIGRFNDHISLFAVVSARPLSRLLQPSSAIFRLMAVTMEKIIPSVGAGESYVLARFMP